MRATPRMDHDAAAALLTSVITSPHGQVEITTAPSAEQQRAMRSLDASQPAPLDVCDEVDLEAGCSWGAVLREIAFDAGTSLPADDELY